MDDFVIQHLTRASFDANGKQVWYFIHDGHGWFEGYSNPAGSAFSSEDADVGGFN